MASFDTSKIVSDIKSGKIKSKEPPKYILKSNNRGRKVKTLNPRWTAWKKGEKNRQIDKDVETYVKKRKVPINRDLTIDNSKKKKVDKKKTNNTQQTNTPTTTVDKTKSDNKTNTYDILINLVIFFMKIKTKREKAARGILGATIFYAFIVLYLKFV